MDAKSMAMKFLDRMEKATSKETCGDWSARILIENLSTMTKVIREQMAALEWANEWIDECGSYRSLKNPAGETLDSTITQLAALEDEK